MLQKLCRLEKGRATLILAIVALAFVVSACLPGGFIAPAPVGHVTRPALWGLIVENGVPLEGVDVLVGPWGADVCEDPEFSAITDSNGRFGIKVERSAWTVFWEFDPTFDLKICIDSTGRRALSFLKVETALEDDEMSSCELAAGENTICAIAALK